MAKRPPKSETLGDTIRAEAGQIVLVFQGGGALGAYQVGVYQALHEAGVEPDWVVGTSIGAINAALIAGNPPEARLDALSGFWDDMSHKGTWHDLLPGGLSSPAPSYWVTMMQGLPNFFTPNYPAFWGLEYPLDPEKAGYYSTDPLRKTLAKHLNPDRLSAGVPRLTVGAAEVRTSRMHYFDSSKCTLGIDHIVASGALPPAFPAVRIGGELYWDGGILSNTPTEVIFDEAPRRDSLVLAVHLWNPDGDEPTTMLEVMDRQKDIQFSSRVAGHISQQAQLHRLRHIIKEMSDRLPAKERDDARVKEMASWGCPTRMHVVRLVSPRLPTEDHTKDVDFSSDGIALRWQAGYDDTKRMLTQAPWRGEFDPLDGVILHDDPLQTGTLTTAGYTTEQASPSDPQPSLRIVS